MRKLLAVIGHPIAHSLSPKIHDAFIAEAGLDMAYVPFDIKPEEIEDFFKSAKLLNIVGFNVTMPLKEAAARLTSGDSVNTVALKNGVFHGSSTDGQGLINALNGNIKGKKVTIIGDGGSAKAVVPALIPYADITTVARKTGRPFSDLPAICAETDILINTTPLGMEGFEDFADLNFVAALPKHAVVFDLIYVPRETSLIKKAKDLNLTAINGIALLVHQAALSFEAFTGIKPSDELVRELIYHINIR